MRRVAYLVVPAIVAIGLAFPGVSAHANNAPAHGSTVCTGPFSGTAYDLVVPSGATCLVSSAHIQHDVIVNSDGSLAIERSTVGHDIRADKPQNIETGFGATLTPGPVKVGHDVIILGADPAALGYDVCDTKIGRDLVIAQTTPQYEINVGDVGPQRNEFCAYAQAAPNRVGRNLIVYANQPLTLDVGNNTIGANLVVAKNVSRSYTDISDNKVRETAYCAGNAPPPSRDGSEDGPNHAAHHRGC